MCTFNLKFYVLFVAEVQVNIRQEGVGVPEFLNAPWSPADQRIVVNVAEGRSGLILTLIARDSITHERITNFREVAGDPDNLFTVSVNGKFNVILWPFIHLNIDHPIINIV